MEEKIIKFEGKIRTALQIKHKHLTGIPSEYIKYFTSTQIDLTEFSDLYKSQQIYPQIRFQGLVYDLMDIKFQIVLFSEFHLGLYNHLVHKLTPKGQSFESNPYLLLRHLSLDQDSVMKSRIIWERIMNFVYFLETGEKIEKGQRKHKEPSKQSVFFKSLEKNNSPWKFLIQYKTLLEEYDNKFRTPETHKSSSLRSHFMRNTTPDGAKILELSNTAINVFWQNLKLILTGSQGRVSFGESPK